MELFQDMPGHPQLTIQFNIEVHDHYVKKAFHMDDWSQLNIPLLAQMFCLAGSSPLRSFKQAGATLNNLAKHSDVPCHNWSFGKCEEPCSNRQKHGVCCVCSKQHQAKDNKSCITTLRGRTWWGYRHLAGGTSQGSWGHQIAWAFRKKKDWNRFRYPSFLMRLCMDNFIIFKYNFSSWVPSDRLGTWSRLKPLSISTNLSQCSLIIQTALLSTLSWFFNNYNADNLIIM